MTIALYQAFYRKYDLFAPNSDNRKRYKAALASMANKTFNREYERSLLTFTSLVSTSSTEYVKSLFLDLVETVALSNRLPIITEIGHGESFNIKIVFKTVVDLSAYNLLVRDVETMVAISERVAGTDDLMQSVLVSDYPFPEGSVRLLAVYLEDPTVLGENNTTLTRILVLGTRTIDVV